MDVRLPDGTVVQNVPEGTTQADLQARVSRMSPDAFKAVKAEGNVPKKPFSGYVPSGERKEETLPEHLLAYPPTRFAVGAAEPVLGAAQLAANTVGLGDQANQHMQSLHQMTDAGRQAQGSAGFDFARAGGNLMSPVNLAAASQIGNAATTAGRIGQGAMLGAGAGAMAPVYDPANYWTQKATQTGVGAAMGAAIPGAWEGAKAVGRGVRNVAQPYMGEWGADQAAGRLANAAAGDKAQALIAAMKGSQPTVPGSNPTAGQAAVPANSAEFSALQQIAAEKDPSRYFGPQGIEGQQNAARVAALRTVGQTPADLTAAENARSAAAAQNYGAAYQQSVKADPALMQMGQNPYFRDALGDATKLAEANGINPKTDLTQFLHYVKVSLDKQLLKSGDTALGNTEKKAVQDVQRQLVDWMRTKNPAYDTARSEFAQASVPINQMQVGQELEKKLVPALADDSKQRAGVYANAIREAPQTIKRATGSPRYETLDQIMTPQQMDIIGAVKGDLANDATMQSMAAKGMPAARERIGQAIPEAPPTGMFSPVISVARGAYNRMSGNATDKILNELAKRMQSPQETARIMEGASPMQRRALVDAITRMQATQVPNELQGAQ